MQDNGLGGGNDDEGTAYDEDDARYCDKHGMLFPQLVCFFLYG